MEEQRALVGVVVVRRVRLADVRLAHEQPRLGRRARRPDAEQQASVQVGHGVAGPERERQPELEQRQRGAQQLDPAALQQQVPHDLLLEGAVVRPVRADVADEQQRILLLGRQALEQRPARRVREEHVPEVERPGVPARRPGACACSWLRRLVQRAVARERGVEAGAVVQHEPHVREEVAEEQAVRPGRRADVHQQRMRWRVLRLLLVVLGQQLHLGEQQLALAEVRVVRDLLGRLLVVRDLEARRRRRRDLGEQPGPLRARARAVRPVGDRDRRAVPSWQPMPSAAPLPLPLPLPLSLSASMPASMPLPVPVRLTPPSFGETDVRRRAVTHRFATHLGENLAPMLPCRRGPTRNGELIPHSRSPRRQRRRRLRLAAESDHRPPRGGGALRPFETPRRRTRSKEATQAEMPRTFVRAES